MFEAFFLHLFEAFYKIAIICENYCILRKIYFRWKLIWVPASIDLFKTTIETLEKVWNILKLTIKTPKCRNTRIMFCVFIVNLNIFHTFFSVSIVDFEQGNGCWLTCCVIFVGVMWVLSFTFRKLIKLIKWNHTKNVLETHKVKTTYRKAWRLAYNERNISGQIIIFVLGCCYVERTYEKSYKCYISSAWGNCYWYFY